MTKQLDNLPDTKESEIYMPHSDESEKKSVSIEAWIAIGTALIALFGSGGVWAVTRDHVQQLEEWRNKHSDEAEKRHDDIENHFHAIETESQNIRASSNQNQAVIETRLNTIDQRLLDIQKTLTRNGRDH